MAALVREKLIDLGMNTLSPEERCDMIIALKAARAIMTQADKDYLFHLIIGYDAREIAHLFRVTTNMVELSLARTLTHIEQTSGYTDRKFVRSLPENKYNDRKKKELSLYCMKHSQVFI